MARGFFPLASSFLSVTPSKQSSLTISSKAAPVTAFHITLLSALHSASPGGQGGTGHVLGVQGTGVGVRLLCDLGKFA